jgi:hypothetical protein
VLQKTKELGNFESRYGNFLNDDYVQYDIYERILNWLGPKTGRALSWQHLGRFSLLPEESSSGRGSPGKVLALSASPGFFVLIPLNFPSCYQISHHALENAHPT